MQREKISLLAGLLLAVFSVFSQNFALGVRAGYSHSTMATHLEGFLEKPINDLWPNYRPIPSYHLGLTSRISFQGRWSALAELNYERKGGSILDLIESAGLRGVVWTHELHYIGLGLLADYKIPHGPSVQAGLQPGLLVAAWAKSGGERNDLQELLFENFDLGAVAGMEWPLGRGFFLGGRYVWGLLPVSDIEVVNEDGLPLGRVRIFNRALQFSAGYRF